MWPGEDAVKYAGARGGEKRMAGRGGKRRGARDRRREMGESITLLQ
jgi:hypothetical protein